MSETSTAVQTSAPAPRPLRFSFEARSKPLVARVLEREQALRRRWFVRKPRVSLAQIEAALLAGKQPSELLLLSAKFFQFYYHRDDAEDLFEALGRVYLEAASKETENGERQWFLLFQAIEALSVSIQKSPKVLNVGAQSVIVAIYRILGSRFYDIAAVEKEVHRVMLNMLTVKKDPGDLTGREHIIKLYLRGNRYYEALIQMAEYEKIMRAKSWPLYQQKQGEIAFRKAGIFQSMIDFYHNFQAGKKEEANTVINMAKLSGFITRFNRDNRRLNIMPLKGNTILAVQQTIASMVQIANHYYMEAVRSEKFPSKFKAYYFIAHNWQITANTKGAIQALNDGLAALEQMRVIPEQKAAEKLKFLESLYRLYQERGLDKQAADTQLEMAALRKDGAGGQPATIKLGGPQSAASAPATPPSAEAAAGAAKPPAKPAAPTPGQSAPDA
jgi:hypothetical protein